MGPARAAPRAIAAAIVVTAFAVAEACDDKGGTGTGGAGGGGGEGGCPTLPQAMLTIAVRAADGPLPLDTTIRVEWSAGKEPSFALNDPTTWKTLDEANLVCAVDASKPPPSDLGVLLCQLWTSGATRVQISAEGYTKFDETLSPTPSEACEGFLPKQVDIELTREADGGTETE